MLDETAAELSAGGGDSTVLFSSVEVVSCRVAWEAGGSNAAFGSGEASILDGSVGGTVDCASDEAVGDSLGGAAIERTVGNSRCRQIRVMKALRFLSMISSLVGTDLELGQICRSAIGRWSIAPAPTL